MTLHIWGDYEQDRRARAREWTRHSVIALLGGLGMAALVNLAIGLSLLAIGCESVSPELREASKIAADSWHPRASLTETHSPLADDPHLIGCPWPEDTCTCPPIPPVVPKVKPGASIPKLEYTPPVGLWGTLRF